MKLFEMFDKAIPGYQDTEDDNSIPKFRNLRKSKLTLRQIRKLRKMLDIRNLEYSKNLDRVHDQYGPKAVQQGPML